MLKPADPEDIDLDTGVFNKRKKIPKGHTFSYRQTLPWYRLCLLEFSGLTLHQIYSTLPNDAAILQ